MQKHAVAETGKRRYKFVTAEKSGGATYTPSGLADFVAQQIINVLPEQRSKPLRVLDPAIGEGALLVSLLRKLEEKGFAKTEVYGFETDPDSLALAGQRLRDLYPCVRFNLLAQDFLEFVEPESHRAPLFVAAEQEDQHFDVIIANPPYVRTQVLGADHAQALAKSFGLVGRADLYHAFVLAMVRALGPEGVAGIIVSNRFMSTRSGARVRSILREDVALRHIWDLGDTKLFDAAVLPAVLVLQKSEKPQLIATRFSSIYETSEPATVTAQGPLDALRHEGPVATSDGRRFMVVHGRLDWASDSADVWRVATEANDLWLKTVLANTWLRFGNVGSIRVGIKTCADGVYIRNDWHEMSEDDRPELLYPLTTHHVARRFRANDGNSRRQVLYPHASVRGQRTAVNLDDYPRTAAYLAKHRFQLESRSYVLEAGRNWYEIWVPQDPASWQYPKLVFRDISEDPVFWLDLDGTIVNGDCYWLQPRDHFGTDVLWLASAVANSHFVEEFYDHSFHNKLYAGRRRFMTQYVERFPLPAPDKPESRRAIECAKRIYSTPDDAPAAQALQQEINLLVRRAFGLCEEVSR